MTQDPYAKATDVLQTAIDDEFKHRSGAFNNFARRFRDNAITALAAAGQLRTHGTVEVCEACSMNVTYYRNQCGSKTIELSKACPLLRADREE